MSKVEYTLKYCDFCTEWTKEFFMIQAGEIALGAPISNSKDAILICDWLNTVHQDSDGSIY